MAANRLDMFNDPRTDRILEALDVINVKKELNRLRSILGDNTSWVLTDDRRYAAWKESKTGGIFHVSGRTGTGKGNIAIAVKFQLLGRYLIIREQVMGFSELGGGQLLLKHYEFCGRLDPSAQAIVR